MPFLSTFSASSISPRSRYRRKMPMRDQESYMYFSAFLSSRTASSSSPWAMSASISSSLPVNDLRWELIRQAVKEMQNKTVVKIAGSRTRLYFGIPFISSFLRKSGISADFIENSVDEPVGIICAVFLRDIYRFVNDDRSVRVFLIQKRIDAHAQNRKRHLVH